MTDNEDKIRVLERALMILDEHDGFTWGICDALNFAVSFLDENRIYRDPKFYKIRLPKREYSAREDGAKLFSYPCTAEGKQQRIEIIKEAIKKLQS